MSFSLVTAPQFEAYQLLDSGDGERLERFGEFVVRKPDPQCLWHRSLPDEIWAQADAVYSRRGEGDKGDWMFKRRLPARWELDWNDIRFYVEPTPFKHLGVFPEQAVHWTWMGEKILLAKKKQDAPIKILNLFGYTGIASVVCAKRGAAVTHVDASKPSLGWAKENMLLSGLSETSIRWILEDVMSFVKREVRRGNTYEGIIMDPPIFGHGVKGELWKFSEHFPELIADCVSILSPNPLFVIVNAYAVSASAVMLQNVLEDAMLKHPGLVTCGELVLEQENKRQLSTGIFGRWESTS